jgi:DNA (cytosine-5)-methyltransferase 1
MIHFSLFSGIGGFDLASEWMGWKNYLSCEIADFPNKILEHYWPDAYHHRDVKTLNYETINNELSARFGKQWRDDDIILTGGFPCQPYSSAGKRLGKEDERHLWPEMLRIISEIKPKFIVGENVFGLLNWNGGMVFAEVCSDLEHQGYEITPVVIPAAAVNAPHGRDRVWFVAYSNGTGEKHNGGTNIAEEREVWGNEESNVLGELCGDGVTTNSDSISNRGMSEQSSAAHKQRRSSKADKKIGINWEQQPLCNIASEGNATDTERKRLEGHNRERERCTQHRSDEGLFIGAETEFNATNSTSTGRGQDNRIRKSRLNNQTGKRNDWSNFPTQSPICGGDDGLPTELDGITFPKWRAESIKGYGNAICPQVTFEIFKAIEKTYFDFQK